MENETVTHLFEGLIIMAIIIVIIFASPGELLAKTQENVPPDLVADITNNKPTAETPFGPVKITKEIFDGNYIYHIAADPNVKLIGNLKSDVSIITILRFKGQSIRAIFNDHGVQRDSFSISPDNIMFTPTLTGEITSPIPPITEYRGSPLSERAGVLVKSDSGAMIAYVNSMEVSQSILEAFNPNSAECRVNFVFECNNYNDPTVAGRRSITLKECKPDGKLSDCSATLELCTGTVEIKIGKADCSARTVEIENLDYRGGKEWPNAGEKVYISFWKDTDCTRETTDFRQLLVRCSQYEKNGETMRDRLGGEFGLTHPLIQ